MNKLYRTFLSFKYLFHFFSYQWLVAHFTRVLYVLLSHVRVRSSRQEVFCKKGDFRNFAKFTGNACARVSFLKKSLWHRCFSVNFAKLFFLQNTSGGCFWRFRVNLHSIVLELLARNRRLRCKWAKTSWKYNRSNIVQTSFLCYVAGF